jgi:cytochrome P450
MELAKDPDLLRQVRDEVMTAFVTDPVTQERTIHAQTLMSLPLLQSVYVEMLRLHVSIDITREIMGPIMVEGYN